MAVCPEETANRVFQRSLSIPITMRAVINQGKGRIKQLPPDEAEVHVGGHMNGLGPGLGSPSGLDTKPMQTSAATRFKMEGGGGGGGGGTPACVKAEAEPMEGVEAGDSSDSQSLNTCGPQEQVSSAREHHAGARAANTPQFRHPAASSFSLTPSQAKPKKEAGSSKAKEGGPRSVQPNVSITPMASPASSQEAGGARSVTTSGIEIIPLGGKQVTSAGAASAMMKVKSSLKRSFSEDDKRRLQPGKKDKKRRDEKGRQSLNQEGGKVSKEIPGSSWAQDSDSRSNLAGVIERLSQKNKDNLSIEIKPAMSGASEKMSTAPNMEITLNQVI